MAEPNYEILRDQIMAAQAAGQPLTAGQLWYLNRGMGGLVMPATGGAPAPIAPKPVDPDNPYSAPVSGGGGTVQTGTVYGWATPQEMMDRGYEYRDGKWVLRQGSTGTATNPEADLGLPPLNPPATMGPRPVSTALGPANALPTTGSSLDTIRMTTGIGAGPDGALTPIREGISALPRIIYGDVST